LNPFNCHGWFAGILCAAGLAAHAHLEAAEKLPPVCISEFMANNQNGLKDEKGQHSGWIEIYNTGAVPLDLAGWFFNQ